MARASRPHLRLLTAALPLALCACTQLMPGHLKKPVAPVSRSTLAPATPSSASLAALPAPRGRLPVAVYGFRDLTGQYKPAPDSSYSTAMSQGGTAILTKALLDSQWFLPLEREGLQNLLTERRIARAQGEGEAAAPAVQLPALLKAAMIIEGGIVGYESNVRTGGMGVRYFGIGASDQYRVDQITVSLRAVDVRTGQVMAALTTTKTVYSMKVAADVYRYISFKRLLDAEAGFTRNEPAQLCLQDAVEAAVVHLVALGIERRLWDLKSTADRQSPVLQEAWAEQGLTLAAAPETPVAALAPATSPAPASAPASPTLLPQTRVSPDATPTAE